MIKLPTALIEKAATTHRDKRPKFNGVFYRDGHLLAGDGYIAARIEVEADDQEAVFVPAEAIRYARREPQHLSTGAELHFDDEGQQLIVRLGADGLGRIPVERGDDQAAEALNREITKAEGRRGRRRVALDLNLLSKLASALCDGSPWIMLEVAGPEDPVVVRPLARSVRDKRAGAIMPIMLGDEEGSKKRRGKKGRK
jgi:hypothetical protein